VFVDDGTGRIAYYPAVLTVAESEAFFERLARDVPWAQERMWMYDRTVEVPRLVAGFGPHEPLPADLATLKDRAERVLETQFNSVGLNYYRSASDSVAWHNDHAEELVHRPVIALLSLGSVREMLVRSKARPRRTFACDLDPGSLFVMSGRSQEFWEHHVPKAKRAVTPRISVAFRQRPDPARYEIRP